MSKSKRWPAVGSSVSAGEREHQPAGRETAAGDDAACRSMTGRASERATASEAATELRRRSRRPRALAGRRARSAAAARARGLGVLAADASVASGASARRSAIRMHLSVSNREGRFWWSPCALMGCTFYVRQTAQWARARSRGLAGGGFSPRASRFDAAAGSFARPSQRRQQSPDACCVRSLSIQLGARHALPARTVPTDIRRRAPVRPWRLASAGSSQPSRCASRLCHRRSMDARCLNSPSTARHHPEHTERGPGSH